MFKAKFDCVPYTLAVTIVPRRLPDALCIYLLIATLINHENHQRRLYQHQGEDEPDLTWLKENMHPLKANMSSTQEQHARTANS